MIRGVKKQIIEVQNTENDYFEKAILIVSDKYCDMQKSKLDKRALEYVSGITPTDFSPLSKKKSSSWLFCLRFFALIAVLFVVSLIIYLLLK